MTTRRSKVLGAAVAAATALGISGAFSAPAFAAETGSAKPAVTAQRNAFGDVHFKGMPIDMKLAPQFRAAIPFIHLGGGATFIKDGLRLGGGEETLNLFSGAATETFNGNLTYTLPHQFTIHVQNFKFEAAAGHVTGELVGDATVTVVGNPRPITFNGLNLLDIQLTKGQVSFSPRAIVGRDLPGLFSQQGAQLAQGQVKAGTLIADVNLTIQV